MVVLTKDGHHGELHQSIASTELYQQLEAMKVRFVGIYDVKSAKLVEHYECDNIFQREPLVDEADFEDFLRAMDQIMKPGIDFLWVFAGREAGNPACVMKLLTAKGLSFKPFYLNYDAKLMERYYWKRCRGLANSKSVEKLFLCWKGRLPPNMPKSEVLR